MANVARRSRLHSSIETYLKYVIREWSFIPEQSVDWCDWDDESKLVFKLNWGVVEDRLGQIQRWAADGVLTPEELERYHQLEALVTANRPTLEAMFEA